MGLSLFVSVCASVCKRERTFNAQHKCYCSFTFSFSKEILVPIYYTSSMVVLNATIPPKALTGSALTASL